MTESPWPFQPGNHFREPVRQHRRHALERLVEQQQPGAAHQCARQRHQFLLAAGKLQRLAAGEGFDFGDHPDTCDSRDCGSATPAAHAGMSTFPRRSVAERGGGPRACNRCHACTPVGRHPFERHFVETDGCPGGRRMPITERSAWSCRRHCGRSGRRTFPVGTPCSPRAGRRPTGWRTSSASCAHACLRRRRRASPVTYCALRIVENDAGFAVGDDPALIERQHAMV